MPITIRPETQQDHKIIYQLNKHAFERDNEAKLVNHLRESSAFIPDLSLVAEMENQIIGHILFVKILIKNSTQHFESLALAPMAVHHDFQKQGFGARLIQEGVNRATELGFKSVIVLGYEQFYIKFGFEPAQKWGIKAPFDVPSEAFMAIELVPNALENVNGMVQYPKEFELV